MDNIGKKTDGRKKTDVVLQKDVHGFAAHFTRAEMFIRVDLEG